MFKNFDGANEKLIKEFEEEIKFELPIDYSEFLLKTNGGTFDNFENSFKYFINMIFTENKNAYNRN